MFQNWEALIRNPVDEDTSSFWYHSVYFLNNCIRSILLQYMSFISKSVDFIIYYNSSRHFQVLFIYNFYFFSSSIYKKIRDINNIQMLSIFIPSATSLLHWEHPFLAVIYRHDKTSKWNFWRFHELLNE